MHKFVLGWMRFWRPRKWLFAMLVSAVIAVATFLASTVSFNSNIRNTIPRDSDLAEFLKQVEEQSNQGTLYITLGPSLDQLNDQWAALDTLLDPYVSSEDMPGLATMAGPESIYEHLPLLILPGDYSTIDSVVSNAEPQQLVEGAIRRLSSPESWIGGIGFNKDPYGLVRFGFMHLRPTVELSPFDFDGEVLRLDDGREARLYQLREFKDRTRYVDLLVELRDYNSTLANEGLEMTFFSPTLIEAANVWQIRKDLRWTMTLVIIAILVLLIIVYRNLLTPVQFIIPGLLGILLGLAVIGATGHEISAIAIGAASVILGIVLDYSFHFFTHYRRSGSLEDAISEVSNPMLTSCLTTVLAFGLLLFTGSTVLQDFGRFAALSLAGAAFSVLFIMPVFLPLQSARQAAKIHVNLSGLQKYGWLILGVVSVLTIFFATRLDDARYNADLTELNYYPEWLQHGEETFTGIRPGIDKRLLLHLSPGDDRQLELVMHALDSLATEGQISGYYLDGLLNPTVEIAEQRNQRWLEFWKGHSAETALLDSFAVDHGFRENALQMFFDWTQSEARITRDPSPSFLVTTNENTPVVQAALSHIAGVQPIDMADTWRSLVSDIKDNFNLILFGTAILVFIILLVVYGRLELTLITFMPMVLSWIWIVGATSLLGIEFNFINIILATFIFGLGDDFAIFMTSAHLERYRTGKGDLGTNRLAIFLSAFTTLIGMGVLLTAQHPALRSLSSLSILGIITILLISLIVQPILIRLMITGRTDKGNPPMTILDWIFSIWTFGLFAILSLLASFTQLILRILPGSRRKKARVLRWILCNGCRLILNTALTVRFRKVDMENLDFSSPSIIVANHQSFVDILQMVSLDPDLVILTKKWVYHSPLFGPAVRYADYLYTDHGFEANEEKINALLEDGCSIMIFPEGTRTPEGQSRRWQKGALYLSEHFKLDISPIVLHGYGWIVQKGTFTLQRGIATRIALPRIKWNDPAFGTGYRERTKAISRHFRKAYAEFDRHSAMTKYHFPAVLSNYIYKGPVIEWYMRIKWRLEHQNYERIDASLPRAGMIYDLGCGMGYISLYLHLRSVDRRIIGIDYDEEKVAIAQNLYLRGDELQFKAEDIRDTIVSTADGILLGDVLHYLPASDQEALLDKCVNTLNPGGRIVIRDGLRSDADLHKRTEKSEVWSTRIARFNKTDSELHFFDLEFLQSFARKHGLEFEIAWQSEQTSNALCILKRS